MFIQLSHRWTLILVESKWVNDCCLTRSDHFTAICNHSMICCVLYEHVFLDFMVPTHCNSSQRVDITLIASHLVCFYSLMMHFDEKVANPNFIVLVWPDGVWNLGFIRHSRRSHQCLYYSECYVSNYYRWGCHIIVYISVSWMFGCGIFSIVKMTNRVLLSFKTKRQLFAMFHWIICKAKRFTRKN